MTSVARKFSGAKPLTGFFDLWAFSDWSLTCPYCYSTSDPKVPLFSGFADSQTDLNLYDHEVVKLLFSSRSRAPVLFITWDIPVFRIPDVEHVRVQSLLKLIL